MWFGEPHPFPGRGSPARLSASEQQSYEGWSCRSLNLTSADSKNKGFEFELKVSINIGGSWNSDTDGAKAPEVLRAADVLTESVWH